MSAPCILYLRTNVASDSRISEQKKILNEFASTEGYSVSEFFTDNGKLDRGIEDRQGLTSALNYLKEHREIRAFVIQDINLLAEGKEDYSSIRRFLENHRVQLISINQRWIDEGPETKFWDAMMDDINKLESRMLSQRTKEGIRIAK